MCDPQWTQRLETVSRKRWTWGFFKIYCTIFHTVSILWADLWGQQKHSVFVLSDTGQKFTRTNEGESVVIVWYFLIFLQALLALFLLWWCHSLFFLLFRSASSFLYLHYQAFLLTQQQLKRKQATTTRRRKKSKQTDNLRRFKSLG